MTKKLIEALSDLPKLVTPAPDPEPEGPEVRVALIQDVVGVGFETPEQETAWVLRELRSPRGGFINAKLVHRAQVPLGLADAPDFDLLIVDYGGLSRMSHELTAGFSQQVRDWAADHPGKLVVLWTSHTIQLYQDTFRGEFDADAAGGNILARYGQNPYGAAFLPVEKRPDFWPRLRVWFGYPAKVSA